MRRFITTFLAIVMLILAISVPASAASYIETFTDYDLEKDFTEVMNDGNGNVIFAFYEFSVLGPESAYAGCYVPTEEPGRVFAFIRNDIEARSASGNEIVDNTRICTASLLSTINATKTNHFAARTVNGEASVWDYTYISPYHIDDSETEDDDSN